MASLRRKYQSQTNGGNEPPVMSPPAVEPPPAVGPIETKSPADAAASSAIKDRLAEMRRAEQLVRQAVPPPPPQAPPPVGVEGRQQQEPEMPAAVVKWLSEHPQYMDPNDQIAQAEIYTATLKAGRDGLTWNDDNFLPTIERHLGMAPATNGHAEAKPTAQPTNDAARPAAPQQSARPMSGPAVSAPPSREVPSYSTGRSPRYRAPLTRDELEIAAASGQTPEQYQAQKEKMLRMKAAGEIQNG